MVSETANPLSNSQQFALITLRTLIGWHFLYEGYYKIVSPAWSPNGKPLPPWTSAGYLTAATGPLARLFQRLVDAGWTPWLDRAVKFSLLLIGLSLLLGLLTQAGCWAALSLLTLFYVLNIPLAGVPQPNSEGVYLIVNKTLIEGIAVWVLLVFNTGAIAGLDLLLVRMQTPTFRLIKRETPSASVANSDQRRGREADRTKIAQHFSARSRAQRSAPGRETGE